MRGRRDDHRKSVYCKNASVDGAQISACFKKLSLSVGQFYPRRISYRFTPVIYAYFASQRINERIDENDGKYSIEKEAGSWPDTARTDLRGYIKSNNSKKNMMLVLKVDDKDYITLTRDMSSESSDMFNIGYVDSTGDYIFGI